MTPTDSNARQEALLHEYSEAALSFRHYSALRFGMFSIYVAILAALGSVALGVVGETGGHEVVAAISALGALLVTCVFFICEKACSRDRQYFADVMRTLEETLPHKSMTNFPSDTVVRPANAFKCLFITNIVVWTVVSASRISLLYLSCFAD